MQWIWEILGPEDTPKYKNGLCPREMLVKLSTYLDIGLASHLNATGVGSHLKTTLVLLPFRQGRISNVVTCFILAPSIITTTTFLSPWGFNSFDSMHHTQLPCILLLKSLSCLFVWFWLNLWKTLNTFSDPYIVEMLETFPITIKWLKSVALVLLME